MNRGVQCVAQAPCITIAFDISLYICIYTVWTKCLMDFCQLVALQY